MRAIVSINSSSRDERDFTVGGKCLLVETENLIRDCGDMCVTVFVHANDIRDDPVARRKVLRRVREKRWKLVLFTKSATEGPPLLQEPVFPWDEIVQRFPNPPLRRRQSHLFALAILCQGYLAAYCESQNGKVSEPGVKKSLKMMVWPKLEMGGELGKRLKTCWSASNKTNIVPLNPQYARWWLLPFNFKISTRLTDNVEWLKQAIKKEWGSHPSSVDKLLELIRNGNVDKPAAVAKAFLDLAKQLGARIPVGTQEVKVPEKFFVVGDGMEARALAHCLLLFTSVVHISAASKPDWWKSLDNACEAVVVLGFDGDNDEVWKRLAQIRLKHRWTGRVLIVLPPDQRGQFDENVFVQWQDSKYPAYGFVPRPLDLNLLLQSASALTPYREHGFKNYLKVVKTKSGFDTAVAAWRKLQKITDHQRREQAGRNLGKLFLGMNASVRRCIMKHSEEYDLRKLVDDKRTPRQNWRTALEMIVNRIP